MKKQTYNLLSVVCFLISGAFLNAQVGVGTADPKATLDIKAQGSSTTADGGLLPSVTKARAEQMADYALDKTLVYIENSPGTNGPATSDVDASGFYFFSGGKWTKLNAGGGTNLYKNNGSLNDDRVVNQQGHTLPFKGGKVGINQVPDELIEDADLQVKGLIRSTEIRKKNNELPKEDLKLAKEVFVDSKGVFRVKDPDIVEDGDKTPTCVFTVDRASKLFWNDNFYVNFADQEPIVSHEDIYKLQNIAVERNQYELFKPLIKYLKDRETKGCITRFENVDLKQLQYEIYCRQLNNPATFKFNLKKLDRYSSGGMSVVVDSNGFDHRGYVSSRPPYFKLNLDDAFNREFYPDGDWPIPLCPPMDPDRLVKCFLIEDLKPTPPRPY